jgi:hypothetical protein
MIKTLPVLIVALLSGCAVAPLVISGVSLGGVAVNETTGKTITDHAVSAVNGGKDCRVSRALDNKDVCQDPTVTPEFKVTVTGVTPSTVEEIQSRYK